MKLSRTIKFYPAWDHRETVKGGGIGACRVAFILKGRQGAVTFQVSTGWYLPQNREWTVNNEFIKEFLARPSVYDLGYHSYKPRFGTYDEDYGYDTHKCEFLGGKTCYYDGSAYTTMDHVLDILIAEGSEGLWKYLEQEYKDYFRKELPRWWPFKRKG